MWREREREREREGGEGGNGRRLANIKQQGQRQKMNMKTGMTECK